MGYYFVSCLADIQHRYLGNGPAIVGAGYLELYHGDGIRGTAYDTQTAADTLLFVDNHIGSAAPVFRAPVHRIAFDNARESFHTDTVVRTDVHAARAENTD